MIFFSIFLVGFVYLGWLITCHSSSLTGCFSLPCWHLPCPFLLFTSSIRQFCFSWLASGLKSFYHHYVIISHPPFTAVVLSFRSARFLSGFHFCLHSVLTFPALRSVAAISSTAVTGICGDHSVAVILSFCWRREAVRTADAFSCEHLTAVFRRSVSVLLSHNLFHFLMICSFYFTVFISTAAEPLLLRPAVQASVYSGSCYACNTWRTIHLFSEFSPFCNFFSKWWINRRSDSLVAGLCSWFAYLQQVFHRRCVTGLSTCVIWLLLRLPMLLGSYLRLRTRTFYGHFSFFILLSVFFRLPLQFLFLLHSSTVRTSRAVANLTWLLCSISSKSREIIIVIWRIFLFPEVQ